MTTQPVFLIVVGASSFKIYFYIIDRDYKHSIDSRLKTFN